MTKMKLFKQDFCLKDSKGIIISEKEDCIETALRSIENNQRLLEDYIKEHTRFLHSFEPVKVDEGPKVVKLMVESSEKAGVGPMAAVAGVLADLAVKDMINSGCEVAVVENGGEISAISNQPIDIAFAAGDEPLSKEIGFRLKEFPIGVATSSGRYSHAFSFGDASGVTIFADNAGVADAAATAVANSIIGDNIQKVIRKGINVALNIDGVKGVFILYRGVVGKAGQIPELLKINCQK